MDDAPVSHAQPQPGPPSTAGAKALGCLLLLGLLVGGLWLLGWLFTPGPDVEALVACEQAVEQRVGAELEHGGGQARLDADGQYVVRSSFVEPTSGRTTSYVCTVARDGEGWRLVDLVTDR